MNKIFIKKDYLAMKELSAEGIMVYCGISRATQNHISEMYTSISLLESILKSSINTNDRYFKEKIKLGLVNLVENDIIMVNFNYDNIYKLKPNDTIIISTDKLRIDNSKEKFVLITNDELTAILGYKEKKLENEKVLRYFLNVVGTINNNTKVGFTTLDQLSKMSYIHIDSATRKYNTILEELKLLYIHRHERTATSFEGFIHKISNTYGRYSDKDNVVENVKQFYGVLDDMNMPNISSDEARGIKIKWNNMVKKLKNGYEPPVEIVNELDGQIKLYNKRYFSDKTMQLEFISELVGILKC